MTKDEGFTLAQADFLIQQVLWTLQGYDYDHSSSIAEGYERLDTQHKSS
jgi:hypothetical protein